MNEVAAVTRRLIEGLLSGSTIVEPAIKAGGGIKTTCLSEVGEGYRKPQARCGSLGWAISAVTKLPRRRWRR
jgi:hypothetical protein